ncbi:unnamed protein product [Rotaria sordida]|uniref:Uncharacterized protein n=1 Tax=Rotaria sordida TaxID=392033 RepID=A0A819MU92_9BILA|nr:unnamed protein product [Rotaria sordida]CAF3986274.1 unnamed protein product [Rotaria sordida]
MFMSNVDVGLDQEYLHPYPHPEQTKPVQEEFEQSLDEEVRVLIRKRILGDDWCTQNVVRVNYDKNQVSIRSPTRRLVIPYDKSIDYLTLDVKLINTITVPPRESYTIKAKIELFSANTVYFHSNADTKLKIIPTCYQSILF